MNCVSGVSPGWVFVSDVECILPCWLIRQRHRGISWTHHVDYVPRLDFSLKYLHHFCHCHLSPTVVPQRSTPRCVCISFQSQSTCISRTNGRRSTCHENVSKTPTKRRLFILQPCDEYEVHCHGSFIYSSRLSSVRIEAICKLPPFAPRGKQK